MLETSRRRMTVARVKRALTIMGRQMNEAESDFSKLLYPAMQVDDIFELDVDIALGGMDQRRAHVLQREIAEKTNGKKVIAVHTPLLPGLSGSGRMDAATGIFDGKMSKSKPESCIFIDDTPEEIRWKIKRAYCPPKIVEENPIIQMVKYIAFPKYGQLKVERSEKYGGDLEYSSYEELEKDYLSGALHPLDLKNAVSNVLVEMLKPVRSYAEKNPDIFNLMRKLTVTR